jgi:hypothetical protein
MPSSSVTREEFVRIYQSSASTREAAERLGIKPAAVFSRAKKYRDKGVRLKQMPGLRGSRTIDVDSLNALIDSEFPPVETAAPVVDNGAAARKPKRSRKKS